MQMVCSEDVVVSCEGAASDYPFDTYTCQLTIISS